MPGQHHIYRYREMLYLPRVVRTDVGIIMELPPVREVSLDRDALIDALRAVLAAGNPIVPTPHRNEYAAIPGVAEAAGAKSWRAFEKHATLWRLVDANQELRLDRLRKDPRGWGPPEWTTLHPQGEAALARIASHILEFSPAGPS